MVECRGRDAGAAAPAVPPADSRGASSSILSSLSSSAEPQVRRAPFPGRVREPGPGDGVERGRDVAAAAAERREQQPRAAAERDRVEQLGEACRTPIVRIRTLSAEGVELREPRVPASPRGPVEAGPDPRPRRGGRSGGKRRRGGGGGVDDDLALEGRGALCRRRQQRSRGGPPRRGPARAAPHGPQGREPRGRLGFPQLARPPREAAAGRGGGNSAAVSAAAVGVVEGVEPLPVPLERLEGLAH